MAQGKDRLRDLISTFPASPAEKQEAVRLTLSAVDTDALASVVGGLQKGVPARMWSPESALSPTRTTEENIEYGRYLLLYQMGQELARRLGKTEKARSKRFEEE